MTAGFHTLCWLPCETHVLHGRSGSVPAARWSWYGWCRLSAKLDITGCHWQVPNCLPGSMPSTLLIIWQDKQVAGGWLLGMAGVTDERYSVLSLLVVLCLWALCIVTWYWWVWRPMLWPRPNLSAFWMSFAQAPLPSSSGMICRLRLLGSIKELPASPTLWLPINLIVICSKQVLWSTLPAVGLSKPEQTNHLNLLRSFIRQLPPDPTAPAVSKTKLSG